MARESSFKQGLKVIPLYIVTVVIGTVVCAVAYSLYSLCTHMVAGAQVKIFNLNYFLEGVFIFSPAILILSGLLTCAYLIRHPPASAFPTIIYMIIYAVFWIILMPLNFKLADSYTISHGETSVSEVKLSDGFFRESSNGNVYYYTNVSDKNIVDGACIVTNDNQIVYSFTDIQLPQAVDFSDPLIKKTVEMPKVLQVLSKWFNSFMTIARSSYSQGTLAWLCFASVGLALLSVVGLRQISKWRIIDLVLVIGVTAGILVLNILGYTNSFMDPLKAKVDGIVPNVKNPLLVMINIIICIICLCIGIIISAKRSHQRAMEDELYGVKQ
ncbi:MAG: hypothetical protein J5857_06395 [Treponema sp.]|nr:hypothetical protein [Treponema sp.]